MFRSTKGASKQRRNLINAEICALRDLLPISDCSRQRLSQLQVMCLTCVYMRKCHYFDTLFSNKGSDYKCLFNFFQAMPGFLMVVTRDGKLLYVSENVTEHLGHSMMDMVTQGDSVYDFIDKKDHEKVRNNLLQLGPSYRSAEDEECHRNSECLSMRTGIEKEERVFYCRMNIARNCRRQTGPIEHKTIHIRGHFVYPVTGDSQSLQPIFVAMCCPLVSPETKDSVLHLNTMVFYSIHHLDMKYIEISRNGQFHLGYTEEELVEKSWYELLHPEDLNEAARKHTHLIKSSQEMGCSVMVRMQTKAGVWIWIKTFMNMQQSTKACDNGYPGIVCANHVVYESEAYQFKLESQFLSMYVVSSPEYRSQGGCAAAAALQPPPPTPGGPKDSTDPNHYEPWPSSAAAADSDFSRDSRVAPNHRSVPGEDRPYAVVDDFPEYSTAAVGSTKLGRLDCMTGSLLEQLRSAVSAAEGCRDSVLVPSLVRGSEAAALQHQQQHGGCRHFPYHHHHHHHHHHHDTSSTRHVDMDYDPREEESAGERHQPRDSVCWRIFTAAHSRTEESSSKGGGEGDSDFVPITAFAGHSADWNGYSHSDYYLANHNETIFTREPTFTC